MTNWWSIASAFPRGRRRGSEAELRLALAYHNLFGREAGTASEDGRIVMADLADFTGFYRVNGPAASPEERAFSDGMRTTFARLLRFTNLTEDEKAGLLQAARSEALTSAREGDV